MQFKLNCGELAHLPLFLANQKAISLNEVVEEVTFYNMEGKTSILIGWELCIILGKRAQPWN